MSVTAPEFWGLPEPVPGAWRDHFGQGRTLLLLEEPAQARPYLARADEVWRVEMARLAGLALAGGAGSVGVGRAALPQPDFVRQLLEHGRLDRKRICRTFSYCTALMRAKHNELGQFATGCPPFDKETYGPIWDQAKASDSQPAAGES